MLDSWKVSRHASKAVCGHVPECAIKEAGARRCGGDWVPCGVDKLSHVMLLVFAFVCRASLLFLIDHGEMHKRSVDSSVLCGCFFTMFSSVLVPYWPSFGIEFRFWKLGCSLCPRRSQHWFSKTQKRNPLWEVWLYSTFRNSIPWTFW